MFNLWHGDCLELMKDIGIELDKGYFDIAKKRIEEATKYKQIAMDGL